MRAVISEARRNAMTSKQTRSDASGSRRMAWMDWFGLIALGLLMVCSLVLLGQLLNLDMLDNKYLLLLMAGILILNSGHAVVQLPRRPSKGGHAAKIGCGVLAVILSAGMIYGTVAGGSLKSAVTRIVGKMAEKQTIDIIVLKDNEASSIEDAVGYTFGVLENADQENTAEVLKTLSDLHPTSKTYASVPQLADALYDGEVDAIILNDGYLPILEQTEGYTDFDDYTRILKQFDFTKEVAPVVPNESITVEPFVVYCSGIDARNSDVNIQSLSDVNILAVVNPKSRQILLLNTPRDYFLPLSFNGQLDKLTHAGMYGIDESMRVLDDLYGVETQYYARVNFYGLTKIVDALGGVDVYSEQTFTTKVMQIPDKNGNLYDDYFSFTEGMNYNVDGQAALAFCRERYSFSDGDNQRGRNQMAMIKAIFNKATSPAILSTYGEVLNAVADTMITNMPYEDISSLVKMQLSDMSGWNITSYSVTGYGGMEECYSMPGQALWVMWPDYDTVNVAKDLIAQVMAGQTPVIPED